MLAVSPFVLSWQQAGFRLKHQDTKMLMLVAFVLVDGGVRLHIRGFFLVCLFAFEAIFILNNNVNPDTV